MIETVQLFKHMQDNIIQHIEIVISKQIRQRIKNECKDQMIDDKKPPAYILLQFRYNQPLFINIVTTGFLESMTQIKHQNDKQSSQNSQKIQQDHPYIDIPIAISSQQLKQVDSPQQYSHHQHLIQYPKQSRRRKIRTVITKQKVMQLNQLFAQYAAQKTNKNKDFNLKEICKQVNLGYSTVLHKYRQFRSKSKVAGGMLISLGAKKRKYKKSFLVQKLIKQSLSQDGIIFYTAVELAKHIQLKYGHKFSRSIISRHLDQLGYSYKKKSDKNLEQVRSLYAQIMIPLLNSNTQLIYVDQLTISIQLQPEPRYVSLLLIATQHGILFYKLQEGFFTRQIFYQTLKHFILQLKKDQSASTLMGHNHQLHLVMDMNRIHRDDNNAKPGFVQLLLQQNVQVYFMPPGGDFNPIQAVFSKIRMRINEKKIQSIQDLWSELDNVMEALKGQSIMQEFQGVWMELINCLK